MSNIARLMFSFLGQNLNKPELSGRTRYDDVTLSLPLFQRGLRFGPIQRKGAVPGVIHTGRFFVLINVYVMYGHCKEYVTIFYFHNFC
jgi:hypothetical protein